MWADRTDWAFKFESFNRLQPILFVWVNAEQVLLLLRQEPEIAQMAGVYLQWFSFGLPAYAFNSVLRYVSIS